MRRDARPRRPDVGARLRGGMAGAAAHPGPQRRRDGVAAPADEGGLGDAVRHQPPRPLRPRDRPARRPDSSPRRTRGRRQLGRPRQRRRPLRRHQLRAAPLRPVGGLQPVQDRQRPVRGRGGPPLGVRSDRRQRPQPGPHHQYPARPPHRGHLQQPGLLRGHQHRRVLEDHRAGRGDLGAPRGLPAGRGRDRPVLRGLQRGRPAPARCAPGSGRPRRGPSERGPPVADLPRHARGRRSDRLTVPRPSAGRDLVVRCPMRSARSGGLCPDGQGPQPCKNTRRRVCCLRSLPIRPDDQVEGNGK
ncbi:hypothetical protein SGPA1_40101 [Streptomyces misionensis JCM 4497]